MGLTAVFLEGHQRLVHNGQKLVSSTPLQVQVVAGTLQPESGNT